MGENFSFSLRQFENRKREIFYSPSIFSLFVLFHLVRERKREKNILRAVSGSFLRRVALVYFRMLPFLLLLSFFLSKTFGPPERAFRLHAGAYKKGL